MTKLLFNPNVLLDLIGKAQFANKEEANRKKVQNEQYFKALQELLAKNLAFEQLKAELSQLAALGGFNQIDELLNQVTNSYGVSALQQAFKDQNFDAAKQLIDLGASFDARERAEFNVALDSQAVKQSGLLPSAKTKDTFHDVKRFGLTLGIEMVAQDGTSSQIAHIAPTYKIMADSATNYAFDNPRFKSIADALTFADKTGQFSRSTSTNPQAGARLAERIQEGKITTIPIACKGHFMGLSIVPDGPGATSGYMVFTNRGLGASSNDCGTQIFRLDDLSKVNPSFINSMMNGLSNGTSHADIMRQVKQVAGNKPPIEHIQQKGQKHDNCSIANPRANIRGILLCQKAIEKGGFENLSTNDRNNVKADYKDYSQAMRFEKIEELASAIEKNPSNPDLMNIAKHYLQQHPKADKQVKERLQTAMTHANSKLDVTSEKSMNSQSPR